MKYIHTQKQKGFALFYAVLVSSLVLSIGLATFNISFKQGRLVAGALNSQDAFYAADTGLECALYWDIQQNILNGVAENPVISCGTGEDVVMVESPSDVWTFSLTSGTCATVEIDKSGSGTIVNSRGYNSCDITNARRVERGIRATY